MRMQRVNFNSFLKIAMAISNKFYYILLMTVAIFKKLLKLTLCILISNLKEFFLMISAAKNKIEKNNFIFVIPSASFEYNNYMFRQNLFFDFYN